MGPGPVGHAMAETGDRVALKRNWSFAAATTLVAAIALAISASVAIRHFGSAAAAAAFMKGDRLLVDRYSLPLGTLDRGNVGELPFTLSNHSSRPIRCLGANFSCSCMTIEGLPVDIPPGGRRSLVLRFRTANKAGKVSESVRLYTDDTDQRGLLMRVTGQVRDGSGPHALVVEPAP